MIERIHIDRVRLPVSRIAFGTIVATDADTVPQALEVFDAYFEAGGNTFDTAYIYGSGWSDRALGEWLSTRNVRDQVVVLSKGAHTPHAFPDRMRLQLTESLERLQTERVDMYMAHRDNTDIPVGEWVEAFEDLRRDGLIDAYGGSNWTAARIDEANTWARANGAAGFTVMSNQFSLARMHKPTWPGTLTANDPAFREWLSERRITNFAWSSQASGFFAGLPADGHLAHAWYFDDNLERRRRTEELAATLGCSATALALAWLLRVELPIVPIIGPVTGEEVEASLAALDIDLSPDQVRWLDLEDDHSQMRDG